MQFLAKLMRLIGVSQIHTGTAVGKLTGTKKEVTTHWRSPPEFPDKGIGAHPP